MDAKRTCISSKPRPQPKYHSKYEGKQATITWPDKTVTTHKIRIVELRDTVNEMGHAYSVIYHVPFITLNIHGHHHGTQLERLTYSRKVKIEIDGKKPTFRLNGEFEDE
jgi:calcineurin-like phosphoesterase family protein